MMLSRARRNNLASRIPKLPLLLSQAQTRVLLLTGGRVWNRKWGVPVLLLETIGRKSGSVRTTPILYQRDGEGLLVLPARVGSPKPPLWWLNLEAAGEGVAIVNGQRRLVRPHVLRGHEREVAWSNFARVLPDIDEYRTFTNREIPMVRLETGSREPAEEAVRKRRQAAKTGLGDPLHVDLPQGRLEYREQGSGPVLLFVHGLWLNGDLWRKVVPELSDRYRCVVPDMPFGSHNVPLDTDADLSPEGIAQLLVDFADALSLEDVTLVTHDTADAYAQVLVTRHPERVARLVMAPGDAFWNFLPPGIRPMRAAMQVPFLSPLIAHFWHTGLGKRLIMMPLTKTRPAPEILESYFAPAALSAGVRRDLQKMLAGATPKVTRDAAKRLGRFPGPVLIAWTRRHNFVFPLSHGRRLADLFPKGHLELVDNSFAFVPEDQPSVFARLIDDFVVGSTRSVATPLETA